MELKIAGGCGEHGRNCFHVVGRETDFLVDCGVMAGKENGYPRLRQQEIPRIQTVFLTHSHADHTGAVKWLEENGFQGEIVASRHTFEQLPFRVNHAVWLENICPPLETGHYRDMGILWGKGGHCLGSVWYRLEAEGRALLFSGDYTEHSAVYKTDLIREQTAAAAVLDCAYGRNGESYADCCQTLLAAVNAQLQERGTVVLPVPKYGRGLELLALFLKNGISTDCYGDEHFIRQLLDMPCSSTWFYQGRCEMAKAVRPYRRGREGIVFVSDPQLRSAEAAAIVSEILSAGGIALMTGTVEKGTNSAALIEERKMLMYRYPVHLNYKQYEKLIRKNRFGVVIPYHSAELAPENETLAAANAALAGAAYAPSHSALTP